MKTFNQFLVEVRSNDFVQERDDVYDRWKLWTNMTAKQLQSWAKSPVSRMASVDPAAVIKRNLRLLETPKERWTPLDVKDAKRTISFNARMSGVEQGGNVSKKIPFSKRDISLINWAFKPPTVSWKKLESWLLPES